MIRCVLNSRNAVTKNGLTATINELATKEGNSITEVITDLGNNQKGIREIHKDFAGNIEKVVDNVFGRLEIYYPGQVGVVQVAKDGTKTNLPNVSMQQLANI